MTREEPAVTINKTAAGHIGETMKDKPLRATMKDVAQLAGVSTATVSYVLNYSDKEKISHETRLKVFEAARSLKYVPDVSARTLARQRHADALGAAGGLVGIIVNLGESNLRSKLYQYYDVANELQRQLCPLGYDVVFMPTRDFEKDIEVGRRRSLEAVFIIDMDKRQYKSLTKNFYIPIIMIDCQVNDYLFHEVLADYDAVFAQCGAHYAVLEDYSNDYALQCARRFFAEADIFVNRKGASPGLRAFMAAHQGRRGIVLNEVLALQAESLTAPGLLTAVASSGEQAFFLRDTQTIVVSTREKARKAVQIMQILVQLKGDEVPPVSYIGPL